PSPGRSGRPSVGGSPAIGPLPPANRGTTPSRPTIAGGHAGGGGVRRRPELPLRPGRRRQHRVADHQVAPDRAGRPAPGRLRPQRESRRALAYETVKLARSLSPAARADTTIRYMDDSLKLTGRSDKDVALVAQLSTIRIDDDIVIATFRGEPFEQLQLE